MKISRKTLAVGGACLTLLVQGTQAEPATTKKSAPSTRSSKTATTPKSAENAPALPSKIAEAPPENPPLDGPVKRLAEDLNLDLDQQKKLQPIFQELETEMTELVRSSLDKDNKILKAKKLDEIAHRKISALLTPEQQLKLEQIIKTQAQSAQP